MLKCIPADAGGVAINLFLLEQPRLTEGQIYDERVSEEAVATMAARITTLSSGNRRSTRPPALTLPLAT